MYIGTEDIYFRITDIKAEVNCYLMQVEIGNAHFFHINGILSRLQYEYDNLIRAYEVKVWKIHNKDKCHLRVVR